MKLIRCRCGDVVALSFRWRDCHCGQSGGAYMRNGHHITVSGPCVVYGLDNHVFTTGRAEAWLYDESNGKVHRREESA
jgi:hypothetical protein